MRNKPIYLELLAFFFIVVALSFPIQVFLLYDYSIMEIEAVFEQLTLLNWGVITFSLLTSYLVWTVHSSIYIAMALTSVLVLLNNLFVGLVSVDYTMKQTSIATGLFLIPILPVFVGRFHAVLMQPKLQWWRTARRFSKILVVDIIPKVGGKPVLAKTINVSTTGALLEVPEAFNLRETIPLEIYFNEQHSFAFDGRVVRQESGLRKGFNLVAVEFVDPKEACLRDFRRSLEKNI
jgi:hypothetical protein